MKIIVKTGSVEAELEIQNGEAKEAAAFIKELEFKVS